MPSMTVSLPDDVYRLLMDALDRRIGQNRSDTMAVLIRRGYISAVKANQANRRLDHVREEGSISDEKPGL